MSEYPRMLYRPGSAVRVWNAHDVDTMIADNEDDHLQALEDGWAESPEPRDPLDHDGDGRKGGSLPKRQSRKARS